jgi:uncharacterized protein
MVLEGAAPHLPQQAQIDAYVNGGFRFAGMSHRGSLLALPSGIWAWSVTKPEEINETTLARLFAEAAVIEFFILGTGAQISPVPELVRRRLRECRIGLEIMTTGAAVRTYNIVVGENRRAAAGLMAIAGKPPDAGALSA